MHSAKTVIVYIPAVHESMYFPKCSPTSDIIDSFNFANLMGEMVFAFFKKIHISLIVNQIKHLSIHLLAAFIASLSFIHLKSFSPISEGEIPLSWCPRINFLMPLLFLNYLLSLASPIFLSSQISSSWLSNIIRLQLSWHKRLYSAPQLSFLVLSISVAVKQVPHLCSLTASHQ